ncbi:MAG: IS66 family transposase [Carbonactinosporaceae bacterium]
MEGCHRGIVRVASRDRWPGRGSHLRWRGPRSAVAGGPLSRAAGFTTCGTPASVCSSPTAHRPTSAESGAGCLVRVERRRPCRPRARPRDRSHPESSIRCWRTGRHAVLCGLACHPRRPGRKQSKTRNLLERLRDRDEQVLRFARDLAVPFTNNQAERDLRPVKPRSRSPAATAAKPEHAPGSVPAATSPRSANTASTPSPHSATPSPATPGRHRSQPGPEWLRCGARGRTVSW